MFEDLYEKSVRYDDHLLMAASELQGEYDLTETRELAIIKQTRSFKISLGEVAREYQVSRRDLLRRLREILVDGD